MTNFLREIPGPAWASIAVIFVASIAAYKLETIDQFDIESQVEGAMESVRVCENELSRTKTRLEESDMWLGEFKAKWFEERYRVQSLESQIVELQKKHLEASQNAVEAGKVSSVISPSKPKKAAKSKARARKAPKDWLAEMLEAMS